MNKRSVSMMVAAAVAPACLVSAPLAAASWKEIDRLPGDIAVDIDEASVTSALDGEIVVIHATFRRHMPTQIMESDVAINCAAESAKLRGLRLINEDGSAYNQPVTMTQGFHPVTFGSSDAIYFKALCGREIAAPPEALAAEAAPADGQQPAVELPAEGVPEETQPE